MNKATRSMRYLVIPDEEYSSARIWIKCGDSGQLLNHQIESIKLSKLCKFFINKVPKKSVVSSCAAMRFAPASYEIRGQTIELRHQRNIEVYGSFWSPPWYEQHAMGIFQRRLRWKCSTRANIATIWNTEDVATTNSTTHSCRVIDINKCFGELRTFVTRWTFGGIAPGAAPAPKDHPNAKYAITMNSIEKLSPKTCLRAEGSAHTLRGWWFQRCLLNPSHSKGRQGCHNTHQE